MPNLTIFRDYDRILIPKGLLVDCLFLFSFLNPQIPGGLKPPKPPSNVVPAQSSQINAFSRKENKRGESYSFSLFPTDFAEKSEWFDKSLLSKKKWVAQMIPSFFFIYFLCCVSTLLLNESININRINLKSSTGCSLSDQHILSPINPKYND